MANYFVRSLAAGAGNGTSWADAYTDLQTAFSGKAAGDRFWIADDHAQTQPSNLTLTSPGTTANPCFIYCVDHTVASPISSSLRSDPYTTSSPACAQITTTLGGNITIQGIAYCYGVVFNTGSGANTGVFTCALGWTFVNCSIRKLGTAGATGAITLSSDAITLENTTLQFGHVNDRLLINGMVVYRNTNAGPAILGSTVPDPLIRTTVSCNPLFEGIDLSNVTGTLITNVSGTSILTFDRCKLGANVTLSAALTVRGTRIILISADSAGVTGRQQMMAYGGTQREETTLVRTGGASDGTTPFSWNLTSNANAQWHFPFQTWVLPVWGPTTGALVTVSVRGIVNAAAIPNNDDIWIRSTYFGSNSSPIGSTKSSTKADGLATGTEVTADASAWDSLVSARENNHTYSQGQMIKISSNPGRVFFCTTGGQSNSSEPAGYASAVDGGSVTDGAAQFRAGYRFRMSVTLASPNPALAGVIRTEVRIGAASATYYVDPDPILS